MDTSHAVGSVQQPLLTPSPGFCFKTASFSNPYFLSKSFSGQWLSPFSNPPTDVRRISRKLPADSHPPPPLAAMPPPLLMTCHHHTTTMPPPLHHHTTTTTPPPPPPPLMTYFNPAQIQSNAAPCCDLLIFARPVAEYLRNWPPAGCKQNYKHK